MKSRIRDTKYLTIGQECSKGIVMEIYNKNEFGTDDLCYWRLDKHNVVVEVSKELHKELNPKGYATNLH